MKKQRNMAIARVERSTRRCGAGACLPRGPRRAAGSTRWVLPAALGAFLAIAWLARALGLNVGELLGFLNASALFLLGFIALAALAGGALSALRRRVASARGAPPQGKLVKKRRKRGA